ncbi:MAG: hypothetical protein K0B87_04575 [Candidatus Syntrophosphaera sp.]|nr:hypothetical protein [Candidatus Syntrophosphaera sp.]
MKTKMLLAICLIFCSGLLGAQTMYGAFKIETTPRGADVNLTDIDMYLCSTPSPVYPVFMDEYMVLRSGIPGREINLIITRKGYEPVETTIFVPFLYTDERQALRNPTVFRFQLARDRYGAHIHICNYYTYSYPRPRPVVWYVPWHVWYPTCVGGYIYPPPPRPPRPHNPPHHPGGGHGGSVNPPLPPGGGHGGSHGGGSNPPPPPGGSGGSDDGINPPPPPGGGGSNPPGAGSGGYYNPSGQVGSSKPSNTKYAGKSNTISTPTANYKPPATSSGSSKAPNTSVASKPANDSRSGHVLNGSRAQNSKPPATSVSSKAAAPGNGKTANVSSGKVSNNGVKADEDTKKQSSGFLRQLQKLTGK